ncbi:hypothetical protein [Streptomyces sp. C36]|uniref:hypothetical protein n=1 Tax=Streptomyces sp. C36 TaxID=3237122 RepID=UPI0034C6B3C5
MMAKIIATLVWAAVLVGANKLLSGTDWAQYAVTFILGGVYVLLMNKMRAPSARDRH